MKRVPNKRQATNKMVAFDLLIRITSLLLGVLLLLSLLYIAPIALESNRQVAQAYARCNAHYQEQLKAYGLSNRFTFTLGNETLNAFTPYNETRVS